jgi:hypothetical protein
MSKARCYATEEWHGAPPDRPASEGAVLLHDMWDELREQCRALGEDEGGDEAWLACRIRDALDLLEAAGEINARR